MKRVITIDTREHFIPKIKDLLVTSILGSDVPEFSFKCLPLADYLIENNGRSFLIERKSISDFVGSYRELKSRLAKMRKLDYERTGLLLEGTYTVSNGMIWLYEGRNLIPRMPYKTMSNFLTHQQELGTRLYHTMNLEETIWRLIYIHNYLPRLDVPTPIEKINMKEVFSTFPGIGKEKLFKLQKQYNSPLDALEHISNWLPSGTQKQLQSW